MRLGIDLGGTKIEIIALDETGAESHRHRVPTPRSGYDETIRAIRDLVIGTETTLGQKGSLGVAIPGAISPLTGLVKNANQDAAVGTITGPVFEAELETERGKGEVRFILTRQGLELLEARAAAPQPRTHLN